MIRQKLLIGLCAAASYLACVFPVLSQSYYVQLDGGAVFREDDDLDGGDIEYDVGGVFGGRVGVHVSDAVRVELDLAYSENDVDELAGTNLGGPGIEADVAAVTFGVGAYVDIGELGALTPYLGAGIGGAYRELDTDFGSDDEDTGLAAHGEVGLSFDITPHIAVVPHYRYVWLGEVNDDEAFAHWLRLGLRWSP